MFHTCMKMTLKFCSAKYLKSIWLFPMCRRDQTLRFGKDYNSHFNVQQYLQSYNNFSAKRCFPLREFYKLCAELKPAPGSLSVLDIATGPTIAYSICVAPYASKIVFAEYAAPNRAALKAWLQNEKDAYDWMPYFKKIVIEMEGKDEMEVERRVTMVREKVKAVVPCDITKDPPCLKSTCASMISSSPFFACSPPVRPKRSALQAYLEWHPW